MNLQVIDDQDDLTRRIGNQRLQKLDKALGIEATINDLEGNFSLGRDGRNHEQLVPSIRNAIVFSTFVRWIRGYAHLDDPAPKLHATVSLLPVKAQPSVPVTPAPSSSSPPLELRSPSGFVWMFSSSIGHINDHAHP